MQELSTLARPYAQAAFKFSLADQSLKAWSQMLHDAAAVISDPKMQALIDNPNISRETLIDILFSILEKELDEYQKNFLQLLVQNDRLLLLPQIARQWIALYDQHEKLIKIQVTSAFELTDTQEQHLIKALENRLTLTVKLEKLVDKTILGGAIIRAGDQVFNYSGRHILDKLANTLRGQNR